MHREIMLGALAGLSLASAAFAETSPAPKPLAPSVVVAATGRPAAVTPVEASLALAAEGLKGSCETARASGESPFGALLNANFRPAAPRAVAPARRCPGGMTWICRPYCAEEEPLTGRCIFWGASCGCE